MSGNTGCDVLAKLGRPDDFDMVATRAGESGTFWYHTGSTQTYNLKTHMVVMEESESGTRTVVTSVVW